MVRHQDLYHVGLVVDDFAAARAALPEALGITWGFEAESELPVLFADGPKTVGFHLAYSQQGPVRIELVQSVPGTLWTATAGGQAHHLGYWSNDVAAASAALSAAGMPRVAKVAASSEDDPTTYVFHRAPTGPYLEIVDVALRPMLFGED